MLNNGQHSGPYKINLLMKNGDIIPVEVKSGMVTHAKSLSVFTSKYNLPFSIILSAKKKMITATKSHTYYLPLYFAAELSRIL